MSLSFPRVAFGRSFLAITALTLACVSDRANAVPLDWQGVLDDGGAPADGRYDIQVSLHSHPDSKDSLGAPVTFHAVSVKNGQFELPLELDPLQQAQPELWLQLAVRDSGGGSFETLPRRDLAKGNPAACWGTSGNGGLTSPANFLGTVDATPLNFRVNNQRVGVLAVQGAASPSVIMGSASNQSLAQGSVISGGGTGGFGNISRDQYGTIGGGRGNLTGTANADLTDAEFATVGGGESNQATATFSTVAGGGGNRSQDVGASIGGGSNNSVNGLTGTIAGGSSNIAGSRAAVGGGLQNSATGAGATIPGGINNLASGASSFAAGNFARAIHDGAFVWADNVNTNFASARPNQMRMRAANGMHLVGANLNVNVDALAGGDPVDMVIESGDAQIYLMSDNGGNFGSVLALGEVNGGNFVNGWGVVRESTGNGGDLRFTFGTDANTPLNTTRVEFRTNGTAFKSGGGTTWDQVSDARLKRDVQALEGALDRLLQLRGVRFHYSVDALPGGVELPQDEQTGFIAQEVQQVFPDWVQESDEGYLSIGERGTTALLVEALRELSERNAALEARINALEGSLR
jgi:hypothetical protein